MTRDINLLTGTQTTPVPERSRSAGVDAEGPQDSFVLAVLQKRWWVLLICCIASGAVAYFLAMEFGKQSATVRGSLIYVGLPIPPGPTVYQAPSLTTYREILFSTPNMQQICDKHGLGMSPARLAEMFKCRVTRSSSIMDIELQWANLEDGIDMLNDTMRLLIDEAVRQRKEVMLEHMRHVESAQLSARGEVDRATSHLRTSRRQYKEQLLRDGSFLDDGADLARQYTDAQAALEELEVNQESIQQQLARLEKQIRTTVQQFQEAAISIRVEYVDERQKRYQEGREEWEELQDLRQRLQEFAEQTLVSEGEVVAWRHELANLSPTLLPHPDRFESAETVAALSRFDSLMRLREQLQTDLIPVANRIKMQQGRIARLDENNSEVANTPGVEYRLGPDDAFVEEERELRSAESRLLMLSQQLENMKQIEQCRTPEFAVHIPASMNTSVVESNKKKLFVLFFAASVLALCTPLFGIEWMAARESPVARFASRWGLPVIAERLLTNSNLSEKDLPAMRFDEAVRLTTLRIQQCASRSGFVVVLSNLSKASPPNRLISAIAECLAHREERVLVVDARCPSHQRTSNKRWQRRKLTPLPSQIVDATVGQPPTAGEDSDGVRLPAVTPNHSATALEGAGSPEQRYGLGDYLSRECEMFADLIQPTSCPGVDQISAGDVDFPDEAMASSCVSELFDHCRQAYSIILVAGPPVTAQVDFQMLAARADGILLSASRAAVCDPQNHAAIEDLVDLRAPMLGIVS